MRKKIDRFVIQEVLSEGSGGSVYKAEEQLPCGVTRPVALKVLPVMAEDDRKAQQRFEAEVRLCVALSGQPGVVTVYSAGLSDRLPWLAMEYVPTSLPLEEQPAKAEQVVKMLREVGRGLACLHGMTPPVLHNDLSPSNILISRSGEHRISDFGLASPADVERTRVMATVKYAAPELLSRELGPVCAATDLYALGHIAYEMALGGKLYRRQFPAVYGPRAAARDATAAKWMAWHCSMGTLPPAVHELREDFPRAVSEAIAQMMRKTVGERCPTVEAMLTSLAAPQGTPLPPPTPAFPAPAAATSPPVSVVEQAAPPAENEASFVPPPALPRRAAPAAAVGGERLYVRLGGRVSGPFDLATLQQQVRRGLLSRLHQVSSDRLSWRSAGMMEELFRSGSEENA